MSWSPSYTEYPSTHPKEKSVTRSTKTAGGIRNESEKKYADMLVKSLFIAIARGSIYEFLFLRNTHDTQPKSKIDRILNPAKPRAKNPLENPTERTICFFPERRFKLFPKNFLGNNIWKNAKYIPIPDKQYRKTASPKATPKHSL